MTNSDLHLRNLSKSYGSVRALADFSHTFEAGKAHALIGKNGSGKSTFVKMLSGATQPSSGTIYLGDNQLQFSAPADALSQGIATVYQELSLVPQLSVAENIFLGRLPRRIGTGLINWKQLERQATDLLREMGADNIDARAAVSSLSVGKQQIVEIVKAMSLSPRILQLDEPTASLAQAEVQQLFEVVKRLRQAGVTIIYISHRLAELTQIADTVVALRDGAFIGAVPIDEAKPQTILDMMFGPTAQVPKIDRRVSPDDVALRVTGMKLAPILDDVNFDLRRGEVLGIAGMLGSGRTELLRAIYGAGPMDSGTIEVDGKTVPKVTLTEMKKLGIGYASEDRKLDGLVQVLSSHANLCLAAQSRMSRFGFTTHSQEKPFVDRQIAGLGIKIGDPMLRVSSLSGGNQQKVVVGNWLNNSPRIMLFDEPGRGVDVLAKRQIYEIIWAQADKGLSSIVVSTELEDLVECCDRILILRDGKITEEFHNVKLDPKQLYAASMTATTN